MKLNKRGGRKREAEQKVVGKKAARGDAQKEK